MSSILIALAIVLTPLVQALPADCPDVHILGVRGSGQSGYGDQVAAAVGAIEAEATSAGLSVTAEAIDYPAVSVSDSFGLVLVTGAYARSVEQGAGELRRVADRIARACPSTRIVLVGYSQGAHVVKTAFDARPSSPIAAVVLLADPTRDPSQKGILRIGEDPGEAGGAFAPLLLPDQLRVVAIDVCAAEDVVCDRSGGGFIAHVDGYGGFNDDVASAVLDILDRVPRRPGALL